MPPPLEACAWEKACAAHCSDAPQSPGPQLSNQPTNQPRLLQFVVVFNYLKTPPECQRTVLQWGIGTAAVLRAVLIVLGVEIIAEFEPVLLVFAGILLLSSFKVGVCLCVRVRVRARARARARGGSRLSPAACRFRVLGF